MLKAAAINPETKHPYCIEIENGNATSPCENPTASRGVFHFFPGAKCSQRRVATSSGRCCYFFATLFATCSGRFLLFLGTRFATS